MRTKYLPIFLFILCQIFCQSLCAAPATPDNFDLPSANQTLTQYDTQLTTEPSNIKQLEQTIAGLNQLQTQAKKCIDSTQTELNAVNAQLREVIPKDAKIKTPSAEQIYLQTKRDQLLARLSDCRLFSLRSKETLDKYTALAHELATRQLFTVEPNLAAKVLLNIKLLEQLPQQFNSSLFTELSGLELFNKITIPIFFIVMLLAAAIGIKFRSWIAERISPKPPETFTAQFSQAFYSVLKAYAVPFFVLFFFAIFTTFLGIAVTPVPYITWISYALLIYPLFMMLTRLFFYPPEPAKPLANLPKPLGRALILRLQLLVGLLLIAFITYVLFKDQTLPDITVYFARTIFISLLAINLISIVWLVNRTPKLLYLHPAFRSILSFILAIGLFVILIAEWLGYHGIAIYLLTGIALTILVGFIAWILQKILLASLNTLTKDQHPWQQHLHAHLGIKKTDTVPELIWLRILVYLVIWIGLLVVLLKIWGLSKTYFQEIIDGLVNGFTIAHIRIYPTHLMFALLIFILLMVATRWVRTRIIRSPQFAMAPGAHEALAAIASYVGVALAVLIALIMAGVNFAGLAIIAGALSVGIGFGLQNIVNNFVSGIILLIERPIKVGDRIIVGGTEGYVKKINIRFTQVETSQKSDVIIPNAELISQQVTNLMYRDFYSRISVPVSVAYSSDTELVKKILIDVAKQHPTVITDYPANEPKVEFKQFGDSNLNFELSCLIRNVNDQGTVKSDLHFAIDKAFREQGIEISYPQQDIHIRDWPWKPEK